MLNTLPSVVRPPMITFNPERNSTPIELGRLPCPNCGSPDDKALVLTVDVQLPDNPSKRLRVLHCPACTAHFYDDQTPPDYAEPALNNRGRVPFYVQQGAGVSLITRPLAQLCRPPGSAYMEVGCGYGFGLDYAINTNRWAGLGIDPAPLAALGRDALGLPIELRYLRDDDEARGTMDVVMGSEVIEHVTSPKAFVRTLRAMLKPGGVLVLTTPNGDDIDPATPPGIIVPLLSPSLHLVIQNRHSLRTLLRQSGFAHVEVLVDSHSLVAYSSDAPMELETDRATLRYALRHHLLGRAQLADSETDPFLGFAGRAFTESMNDGDLDSATRAWALLLPACQSRFGFALDRLTSLPDGIDTCSLEEMARLVPLNLGSLLYAHGIHCLADGVPRPVLEPVFLLASKACDALRRALGELAMEDGQTEDVGWTALAEAVLCAIEAGTADAAARLADLPPAPNGGLARKQEVGLRALSNLVNAGRYEPARFLVDALALDRAPFMQPGAPLSERERDALFYLAVLDVQTSADAQIVDRLTVARSRLERVRACSTSGGGLWWAALRAEAQACHLLGDLDGAIGLAERAWVGDHSPQTGMWAVTVLCNAGRIESARQIADEAGLWQAEFSQPGSTATLTDSERDAIFALAIIGLQTTGNAQTDDLAVVQGRLRRVRAVTAAGDELWWAALRAEAQVLNRVGDLDGVGKLAEDAWAEHPSPGAAIWALTTLCNAGRYAAARQIADAAGLWQAHFVQPSATERLDGAERDAVFALAMLDVQPSAPPRSNPAAARGRFARVRAACPTGSGLWMAALRGELQALDQLGALDEAAALTGDVEAANPTVQLPPDILRRVGKA